MTDERCEAVYGHTRCDRTAGHLSAHAARLDGEASLQWRNDAVADEYQMALEQLPTR